MDILREHKSRCASQLLSSQEPFLTYICANIKQQQTLHELNAFISCTTLKCHKCDLIGDTSLTCATPTPSTASTFAFSEKTLGVSSSVEFAVQVSMPPSKQFQCRPPHHCFLICF